MDYSQFQITCADELYCLERIATKLQYIEAFLFALAVALATITVLYFVYKLMRPFV